MILTGRVVHPPGVALIFRAQLALGIAGLRGVFRCRNGLGVLFRLAEIDGDVQLPILRIGFPPHILHNTVAADVVRVLAEPVVPVRCRLGRFPVSFREFLPNLPGGWCQNTHQFGVQQIPAGNILAADATAHCVIHKPLQNLFKRKGYRGGRLETVQTKGLQKLVGYEVYIARLDQSAVQAILRQGRNQFRYIHGYASLHFPDAALAANGEDMAFSFTQNLFHSFFEGIQHL